MNEPPIVRVLADEVLWYSQRDGWGHLYRYALRSGELLGQVTSGQWAVRQIVHVDETERVVYFTRVRAGRRGSVPAHGVPGRSGRLRLRQGHRRRAGPHCHHAGQPRVLHRLRVHCRPRQ